MCCPFDDFGAFDPTRHEEIIYLYERTQLVTGGSGKHTAAPWWSDDTPLVDELYDYLSRIRTV